MPLNFARLGSRGELRGSAGEKFVFSEDKLSPTSPQGCGIAELCFRGFIDRPDVLMRIESSPSSDGPEEGKMSKQRDLSRTIATCPSVREARGQLTSLLLKFPEGDVELVEWTDLLNFFDAFLEEIVSAGPEGETGCLVNDKVENDVLLVLQVTRKVLLHSTSADVYASLEWLTKLWFTGKLLLTEWLRVLFHLSVNSNVSMTFSPEKLHSLQCLCQGWGGKQEGLGLLFCSEDSDVSTKVEVGSTLHFEFVDTTMDVNSSYGAESGARRTVVHVPDMGSFEENDAEMLANLVTEFHVPLALHEPLAHRIRLAQGFANLEERRDAVRINLMAFALVARHQSSTGVPASSLFISSPDIIGELMDLIRSGETVPEDIRLLAIDCLGVLVSWDNATLVKVLNATGCAQHHGDIPSIVRKSVAALTGGVDHPIYSVKFISTLWDFLARVLSTIPGVAAMEDSGVLSSLLPLLKDENPSHFKVMLSTYDLVMLLMMNSERAAVDTFRDMSGTKILVQRFISEIGTIQKTAKLAPLAGDDGTKAKGKQPSEDAPSSSSPVIEVPKEREALLVTLLELLVQLIQHSRSRVGEVNDMIESKFPSALCYVFRNHKVFGQTFPLAVSTLTAIINNTPTSYVALQEAGLPSALLTAITDGIVPTNAEQFQSFLMELPPALSALCLNAAGLAAVAEGDIMRIVFSMLTSEKYRAVFRGMSVVDEEGRHAASLLGTKLNELMRHHTSLRPIGISYSIQLLQYVCLLGGVPREALATEFSASPAHVPEEDERPSRRGGESFFARRLERRFRHRRVGSDEDGDLPDIIPGPPPELRLAAGAGSLSLSSDAPSTIAESGTLALSASETPDAPAAPLLVPSRCSAAEEEGEREDYIATVDIIDVDDDFFTEIVENVAYFLQALYNHRSLTGDFFREKGVWLLLRCFSLPRLKVTFSGSNAASALGLACKSLSKHQPSAFLKSVLGCLNSEFDSLSTLSEVGADSSGGFIDTENPEVMRVIGTIDCLTSILGKLVRGDGMRMGHSPFASMLEWTTEDGINVCRSLGHLQRRLLWEVAAWGFADRRKALSKSIREDSTTCAGSSAAEEGSTAAVESEPVRAEYSESSAAHSTLNQENVKRSVMHLVSGIHALSSGLVRALAVPPGRGDRGDGSELIVAGILDMVANTLAGHLSWKLPEDTDPVIKATYISSVVGELRSLLFDQRNNSTHTLLLLSMMKTDGVTTILNLIKGLTELYSTYAEPTPPIPGSTSTLAAAEDDSSPKPSGPATSTPAVERDIETRLAEAYNSTNKELLEGALVSLGRFLNCLTSSKMLLQSRITANMLTQTLPGQSGPFDPHAFVQRVHAVALPTVLECWSLPNLHIYPPKFIKSLLLTVGQLLESEADMATPLAADEAPLDENVVDNLVNNMGFHRPYVEQVLREVGNSNVERAIDRLLSMPPPPLEDDVADDEDDELAAALAMSMGGGTEEEAESLPSRKTDLAALFDKLKTTLFDRCIFLMGRVKKFSLPVAETLMSVVQKNDDAREPMVSVLLERIKNAAVATPRNDDSLFQLMHVLTVLMGDNAPTRCLVADSGVVSLLLDLLGPLALLEEGSEAGASALPLWTGPVFLSLASMCKLPKNMDEVLALSTRQSASANEGSSTTAPAVPPIIEGQSGMDVNRQSDDAKEEDSDRLEMPLVDLAIPRFLFEAESKQALDLCVLLLAKRLDNNSMHALLQLVFALTSEFKFAYHFVQQGGVAALLTLSTPESLSERTNLFTIIMQHLIEEPVMLQTAMEAEIKWFLTSEASRSRIRPKHLLMSSAALVARSPQLFLQAAMSTCRLKDPDPSIPLPNIQIVGVSDSTIFHPRRKTALNREYSASVVRVVGALVDTIALLPELKKRRALAAKLRSSDSDGAESAGGGATRDALEKKEAPPIWSAEDATVVLPEFTVTLDDVMSQLTKFITLYPPCGRIVMQREVNVNFMFVPGVAASKVKGKEKADKGKEKADKGKEKADKGKEKAGKGKEKSEEEGVNIVRHIMRCLPEYVPDPSRATGGPAGLLFAVLAKRADGRKMIVGEFVEAMRKRLGDASDSGETSPGYYRIMHTMVGLLYHLLSLGSSVPPPSTTRPGETLAELAFDRGIVDVLVQALHSMDLTNPAAPNILNLALKSLALVTKPHVARLHARRLRQVTMDKEKMVEQEKSPSTSSVVASAAMTGSAGNGDLDSTLHAPAAPASVPASDTELNASQSDMDAIVVESSMRPMVSSDDSEIESDSEAMDDVRSEDMEGIEEEGDDAAEVDEVVSELRSALVERAAEAAEAIRDVMESLDIPEGAGEVTFSIVEQLRDRYRDIAAHVAERMEDEDTDDDLSSGSDEEGSSADLEDFDEELLSWSADPHQVLRARSGAWGRSDADEYGELVLPPGRYEMGDGEEDLNHGLDISSGRFRLEDILGARIGRIRGPDGNFAIRYGGGGVGRGRGGETGAIGVPRLSAHTTIAPVVHPLLATSSTSSTASAPPRRDSWWAEGGRGGMPVLFGRSVGGSRNKSSESRSNAAVAEFALSFETVLIDALRRVTALEAEEILRRESEAKALRQAAEKEEAERAAETSEKATAETAEKATAETSDKATAEVEMHEEAVVSVTASPEESGAAGTGVAAGSAPVGVVGIDEAGADLEMVGGVETVVAATGMAGSAGGGAEGEETAAPTATSMAESADVAFAGDGDEGGGEGVEREDSMDVEAVAAAADAFETSTAEVADADDMSSALATALVMSVGGSCDPPADAHERARTEGVGERKVVEEGVASPPAEESAPPTSAEAATESAEVEIPELDPEFLAALPEELRAEALAQHEAQVRAARLRAATRAAEAARHSASEGAGGEGTEGATEAAASAAAAVAGATAIDPEFLAALPAELASQVLADEERRAREAAAAASAEIAPAGPAAMSTADFFASLDPATLSAVLSDADEATLAMLPPHLAAAAHADRDRYRSRARHRLPHVYGIPRPRMSGEGSTLEEVEDPVSDLLATRRKEEEEEDLLLPRLLDRRDLLLLLRLLYLAQPLAKQLLNTLFHNLSAQTETREELLSAMVAILEAAMGGRESELAIEGPTKTYGSFSDALKRMRAPPTASGFDPVANPSHPLISDGTVHAFAIAGQHPPSLVSRRLLEILTHLARKNPKVVDYMVGMDAHKERKSGAAWRADMIDLSSSSLELQVVSDERGYCPLARIIGLLGVDTIRNTSAQLAKLMELLHCSMRPIALLKQDEEARAARRQERLKERKEKARQERLEQERRARVAAAAETETSAEQGEGLEAAAVGAGEGVEGPAGDTEMAEPVGEESDATAPFPAVGTPDDGGVDTAVFAVPEEPSKNTGGGKAGEETEEEKEPELLAEDACPVVPLRHLQYLVQVLTLDYCTAETYAHAEKVLSLLSVRADNREVLFSELMHAAQDVGEVVRCNLERMCGQLEAEANASVLFSMASTNDELNLQRIIQTILHLPSTADQDAQEVISSLRLDPLWEALEHCLGMIARSDEGEAADERAPSAKGKEREEEDEAEDSTSAVANLMLPIIEVFFLVNARDMPQEDLSRSHSVTALSAISKLSRSDLKKSLSRSGSFYNLSGLQSRFVQFVEKNHRLLNNLIKANPALLSGTFNILTNYPKALVFENKLKYFRNRLGELGESGRFYGGGARIKIRRTHVFEDSFSQLNSVPSDRLRGRISVQFQGEEGVDAGGVYRDWFDQLANQMFNANYALFSSTAVDNSTFQPNPHSHINPDHLAYFRFVGRIIARAIYGGIYLPCHFTRSFYKHILGAPLQPQDMEAIDPDFYKSLQWMMDNDITDVLDMTFTTEVEEFGKIKTVELMEGGENIPVNEDNKLEYVQLVTELKMTTHIEKQLKSFLEGFHEIIPKDLISIFNEMELELLISGLPDLDIDDLRNATEYRGYKATDPLILNFWEVLHGLSREDKAKFLQFVTGTSRVPIGGFCNLKGLHGPQRFQIHREYNKDRLPSAHTCFNQLDLPEYDDIETLRTNLLYSIRETEGFGFG